MLQGLLALTKKHASETLEKACEIGPVARLLTGCGRSANCCSARRPSKQPLPFLDEHPLIRPLDDYAASRRPGDPSPGGSPLRGRRFCEA